MATLSANVTSIVSLGTTPATVKYFADNSFSVGQSVLVTNATTTAYNISASLPLAPDGLRIIECDPTYFIVYSSATGLTCSAIATATQVFGNDISEELQYDLSAPLETGNYLPTNVAYDLSFGDNGFLTYTTGQTPYVRETAQYKKDQFDSSTEPGEQSLTGWWLRSQTSWHEGAGLKFFEPGVEKNVTHRFADSRGVNTWEIGEVSLLPDTFHGYDGVNGINAAPGNDGSRQCLVCGDNAGALKKIVLNGNLTATATPYTIASHTTFPFYSVTTDGTNYYAACSVAVHSGAIGSDADVVRYRHSVAPSTGNVFIKYVKGYVLIGVGRTLYNLHDVATATSIHGSGSANLPGALYQTTHLNTTWTWTDATAGPSVLYVSGRSNNTSEIWSIGFDDVAHAPDMNNAQMVTSLPSGEIIKAIHYYLGYLVIGSNKGIRVCPIDVNGSILLGPLLFDSTYPINGFAERGSYLYAASAADAIGVGSNAISIRIDLSNPLDNGAFPWSYDVEYLSDETSSATEIFEIDDRMVMVIEEGSAGQLIIESTTNLRSSGWLQTGYIRYATTEPKFFKYINLNTNSTHEDSIGLTTIDSSGNNYDLINIDSTLSQKDLELHSPSGPQEYIAFKFTLNNNSPVTNSPKLLSYRVKSVPAMKRQRLIQYSLSCYDIEQDRFNSQFGYEGRAYDNIKHMETLEETGDFILVTDWRTGESYTGVIETMRFENTVSPDKNSSGFGGTLTVTIRKVT